MNWPLAIERNRDALLRRMILFDAYAMQESGPGAEVFSSFSLGRASFLKIRKNIHTRTCQGDDSGIDTPCMMRLF